MGRHGGGSSSGGSSSIGGRSGGGSSRSGGRVSTTPFKGCYNRSYVNSKGVRVPYYTSKKSFGTKSGWNAGLVFALVFICVHMVIMCGGMILASVSFGGKVNGDPDRIQVVDSANLLSNQEEKELEALFEEVYDVSGMPITMYTDNFWYKDYYIGNENLTDIQIYSESLYYSMGMDEDAMVILFTADEVDGFSHWEYDMYCGDDTIKCLSDACFNKLLDTFQKSLSSMDLCDAMVYAWHQVMPDLAKTTINPTFLLTIPFLGGVYSIFLVAIFKSVRKTNEAYRYFKKHPEALDMNPMVLYSECPSCGASNSSQTETCLYCGTLLKVFDSKVQFVQPK